MEERDVDINEIIELMKVRGVEFNENNIYILPDSFDVDQDLLNENTPDVFKKLKQINNDVVIVKKTQYGYLSLKDESIILPLILGIPFSILANLITTWITNDDKKVKIKVIKKGKKGKYTECIIEGSKKDVLKIIKEMDK
jgi:hypothetical protein